MPANVPESSRSDACPKCDGTGQLRRTLRLVLGRGANFYRTGAYARAVRVVGARPGDPCPACGGTGWPQRAPSLCVTCPRCGAENLLHHGERAACWCGEEVRGMSTQTYTDVLSRELDAMIRATWHCYRTARRAGSATWSHHWLTLWVLLGIRRRARRVVRMRKEARG